MSTKLCRFGSQCTRPGCYFFHPNGQAITGSNGGYPIDNGSSPTSPRNSKAECKPCDKLGGYPGSPPANQDSNRNQSSYDYPLTSAEGGDINVLDDEDDENIDAFFASMNESPSYPGASGYQDGDMPEDILQEILNLQMDEETIVAPPSPK